MLALDILDGALSKLVVNIFDVNLEPFEEVKDESFEEENAGEILDLLGDE